MSGLELIDLVFLLVLAIAIIIVVFYLLSSKSRSYRKYLADMYVASRIRQLAKEDNLDLDIEDVLFKKYEKTLGREQRDLDNTIEQDLKIRVEDTYNKGEKVSKV